MLKRLMATGLAFVLMVTPLSSFAAIPIMPDMKSAEDVEKYLEQYILQNYKNEITQEQLDLAINKGLFSSLDPYSAYYSKEEYKSLREELSSNFVGVGIRIEPSGKYIKITSPIKGSPAEIAGLQSGDVIYKVDGKDIAGMIQENVVKMIKGDEGTTVKITVWKASTGKEVTYTIKRAVIHIEMVTSKMLANNVGYVKLSEFGENSATEVIQAVGSFKNPKGIVLDLRDNPGGYLSQAIDIADFFLDKGAEIMSIDYKNAKDEVIMDELYGYKLPVVVLVNKNSASASEIVAAALQKNGRAKIVGENSYGKGTVQDVVSMPNGEGFKLTVAEYKGPGNMKINGIGVKPDVEVKLGDQAQAAAIKAMSPLAETKSYKAGEIGLNVYAAQQRLNLLMNSALVLSAKMDPATVTALKAFQKAQKLPVTGLLDTATKKLLDEKTVQLYNRITSDIQLEKALELLKVQ